MEQIYKPKFLGKVISVKQTLADYRKNLLPDNLTKIPVTDNEIALSTGFRGTPSAFKDLLKSVDLDSNLCSSKGVKPVNFHPSRLMTIQKPVEIPEKALRFNCVQHAVKITGKVRKNLDSKIRYNKHKYTHIPRREEPDLVPFDEILLQIRFYEPFKYKSGLRLGHPKFHQEFYALGSQALTDLRDKIYCQCDSGPFYDISEGPGQETVDNSSDRESAPNPGFFFIHDTFYNDTRNPNNMDYSEVIRSWAVRQKSIGALKSKSMQDTKFEDLSFKIGYPQVYQHRGNCEHIFVISDCRLLASSDLLVRKRYPILNSYAFPRSIPCNICGHCEANYIVKGSDQHIFDPAYICQVCFDSYHYEDGKKIGEFEAFRFLGTKLAVREEDLDIDGQL